MTQHDLKAKYRTRPDGAAKTKTKAQKAKKGRPKKAKKDKPAPQKIDPLADPLPVGELHTSPDGKWKTNLKM